MAETFIPDISAHPLAALDVVTTLLINHGAALPPRVLTGLTEHHANAAAKIGVCAEALWAGVQETPDGALRQAVAVACATLVGVCVGHGWQVIGSTDRGPRIAGACRRIVGLGDQDPALDPDVEGRFAAPLEASAG